MDTYAKPPFLPTFFFNWDSLHARLSSHYEAWSYKTEKNWLIHPIRLVNETCAITLVQAGMQANQFARVTDHTGNITHRTGKFFFLKTQKRLVLKFLSVIKSKIMN